MGGYIHLVQTQIAETLHASQMVVWMDGGTMAASGMVGTTEDGEIAVVVGHERPAEFSLPTGKQASEAVHLEKFRVDCRARGGGDPFLTVRPSSADPPDFVCVDQTRNPVGLECAALADEERRSALGHLYALERRLEQLGAGEFRHLRDTAVYVYFDQAGSLGMPRRRDEREAYDALVEAIRGLAVNRVALWLESNEPLPEKGPDIGIVTTDFGDRAHAAPVNDNYRPSRFMRRMGFDLVLGYTSTYRLSEVYRRLNEVVARKDKPGNDWLLLTAGGPNPQGLTFPAEEFVAALVFDNEVKLAAPEHLRRIVLHRWGCGDVWELFPERREVARRARPDLPSGLEYTMPALPSGLAPGRNDPCPCGSGRPFKRCHGAPVPFEEFPSGLLVPR